MKPTIREILAGSHVSAIAVALLLVWSLEAGIQALRYPVFYAADYLYTAIGILGIPYSSPGFSRWERILTDSTLEYLYFAIVEFIAAWLLSRWAYRTGPFRYLNAYWIKLNGRNRA
jgi:hypothetical protein